MRKVCGILLGLVLVACGGGGGGSDSSQEGLSYNFESACGTAGLNPRVINGESCTEENSAIVRLVITADAGKILCTGTVISPTDILTAAHCLATPGVTGIEIKSGSKILTPASYVINALFVFVSEPTVSASFDTAVIKLSTPTDIEPIPVLMRDRGSLGEEIVVFGYGRTEANVIGSLKSAFMVLSNLWPGGFAASFDTTNTNVCKGDSGGPAMVVRDGRPVIMGTTSFGLNGFNCLQGDTTHFPYLNSVGNAEFLMKYAPDAEYFW